jgi:hypothetical protein
MMKKNKEYEKNKTKKKLQGKRTILKVFMERKEKFAKKFERLRVRRYEDGNLKDRESSSSYVRREKAITLRIKRLKKAIKI